MPNIIRLDGISLGIEDVDATLEAWRTAIENGNNWNVSGEASYEATRDNGHALRVVSRSRCETAVVQSGGVTARSGTTLGQGNVQLRPRKGATTSAGPVVKCYSSMSVVIPSGTYCEVAPDGADWKLVGADMCP